MAISIKKLCSSNLNNGKYKVNFKKCYYSYDKNGFIIEYSCFNEERIISIKELILSDQYDSKLLKLVAILDVDINLEFDSLDQLCDYITHKSVDKELFVFINNSVNDYYFIDDYERCNYKIIFKVNDQIINQFMIESKQKIDYLTLLNSFELKKDFYCLEIINDVPKRIIDTDLIIECKYFDIREKYIIDNNVLVKYICDDNDIIVPYSYYKNNKVVIINKIDEFCFTNKDILNVKILNNILTIAYGAFKDCKKLINIELGKNINSLRAACFDGCTSLKEIYIPRKVNYIGYHCFYNCKNLNNITLINKKMIIDPYAIEKCFNVTINLFFNKIPLSWPSNWNIDNRPINNIK